MVTVVNVPHFPSLILSLPFLPYFASQEAGFMPRTAGVLAL
jgi:hypothetical protein